MEKAALRLVNTVDRASIIDEYGELDRKVQQFKPTSDRHETLKKLIKSWYDDFGPQATAVEQGHVYEIQVGARETVRAWNSMSAVCKAVGGIRAFYAVCTVAIGAVEAIIGKSKTSALLVESQSGSRRIKAVAKSVPLQAA